ncbi:hypothetical protein X772_28260 [Mesorhizobium sp. LSJC280B00]|nr:hypothetical protein X772_28260 [Mesorhizobium sp. LSJC280B00]
MSGRRRITQPYSRASDIPFCCHARQHWDHLINIVEDDNLGLPVILVVQTADVLGQRALPRDWHRQRLQHIVEDQVVTRLVLCDGCINCWHGRTVRRRQRWRKLKLRRSRLGAVNYPPPSGLGARINAMPNRAALHEDDRMMTIFAGHRRGQSEDIARFRPAGHMLETRRRKMVALIDDQMTVVRYQVGYFAWAQEALDQRDVNDASRLAASAANNADVLSSP